MRRDDALEATRSISGKTILITVKQWFHIVESHDYMAGNMDKIMETVNTPDYVVGGSRDELLAVKHYAKTNISNKHCVVAYRENEEGFIITAFMTSKPETIRDKGVIWPK